MECIYYLIKFYSRPISKGIGTHTTHTLPQKPEQNTFQTLSLNVFPMTPKCNQILPKIHPKKIKIQKTIAIKPYHNGDSQIKKIIPHC